ncbi:MAG: hypothetical protein HY298_05705 [Verrucomicrobia bacterium]|nr:hypothetical protein [Verrucomicrobiota bacterium]
MASTVVSPSAGAQNDYASGGNEPMALYSTASTTGELHAACAELGPS